MVSLCSKQLSLLRTAAVELLNQDCDHDIPDGGLEQMRFISDLLSQQRQ
jgi:hypothetical protein